MGDIGITILLGGEAENIINKGYGTLMFPSEYRELKIGDIKNWSQIRRDYDLGKYGRWRIFIETNPTDIKQNKKVQYKSPRFIDKDWEGAYQGGSECLNEWVTDHPYGEVYIVNQTVWGNQ
tara:strand:- start:362 stop:724 length:363 start_codon:yes stop_codon:yes gene_type:complete